MRFNNAPAVNTLLSIHTRTEYIDFGIAKTVNLRYKNGFQA